LAIPAPLRLISTNDILIHRNIGNDKFGEELLPQLQQSSKSSQQNMMAHQSARPVTFIPGASEAIPQQSVKSATSGRFGKKKKAAGTGARGASFPVGKK